MHGDRRRLGAAHDRKALLLDAAASGATGLLLAASLVVWRAMSPGDQEQLQTHGLTKREAALIDIVRSSSLTAADGASMLSRV